MSSFQTITAEQCASATLSRVGAPGVGATPHAPVWVARLAVLWGFAGAVLAQTAAFGLIARLALQIDSAMLPSLALSVLGLALGALAMLGSRSFTAPQPVG
jgi:hypothetical protein